MTTYITTMVEMNMKGWQRFTIQNLKKPSYKVRAFNRDKKLLIKLIFTLGKQKKKKIQQTIVFHVCFLNTVIERPGIIYS